MLNEDDYRDRACVKIIFNTKVFFLPMNLE